MKHIHIKLIIFLTSRGIDVILFLLLAKARHRVRIRDVGIGSTDGDVTVGHLATEHDVGHVARWDVGGGASVLGRGVGVLSTSTH